MDVGRNARIEQFFPDGIARSGFRYWFTIDGVPDNMIMMEIEMHEETLRLFFERSQFVQFAAEAQAVAREIER